MPNLFLVQGGETTAYRMRVYFQLVDATDGMTPETGETGGQPQISQTGQAWTNTGIGTLTHVGNGRYYADLTAATVAAANVGRVFLSRYKSANTAECPGDAAVVVAFDPFQTQTQTVSVLPTISGTRMTIRRGDTLSRNLTGLGSVANRSGTKKTWFTLKRLTSDADAASIIMITEGQGLVTMNGATAATAANGSITWTNEAAGDCTIVLDEAETANLSPMDFGDWDLQVVRSTGAVDTLAAGKAEITADVTRAVL